LQRAHQGDGARLDPAGGGPEHPTQEDHVRQHPEHDLLPQLAATDRSSPQHHDGADEHKRGHDVAPRQQARDRPRRLGEHRGDEPRGPQDNESDRPPD